MTLERLDWQIAYWLLHAQLFKMFDYVRNSTNYTPTNLNKTVDQGYPAI